MPMKLDGYRFCYSFWLEKHVSPFAFVINAGQAIVAVVTSGNKRFFAGTDSAPHDRLKKESACGCAGVFNAPVALSVYAKVFEEVYLDCVFLFHVPTHLSFFISCMTI